MALQASPQGPGPVIVLWAGNGHRASHTLDQSLTQLPCASGHRPSHCTSEGLSCREQAPFFCAWISAELYMLLLPIRRKLCGRGRWLLGCCVFLSSQCPLCWWAPVCPDKVTGNLSQGGGGGQGRGELPFFSPLALKLSDFLSNS